LTAIDKVEFKELYVGELVHG